MFKEGDSVQHKSGGPEMTVVRLNQIGEYLCSWMSSSRKNKDSQTEYEKKQASFTESELKPYEQPRIIV